MGNFCVVGQKDAILASHIARAIRAPLLEFGVDYFADSESYVEFAKDSDLADKNVLFVYQFTQVYQGLDEGSGICINHQIFCLLQALYNISQKKPAKIIVVLPYTPYARQV